MAQTIDSKMMTMKVQKFLDSSLDKTAESMQRLGSGKRINSAKDDAAGLAIAERMNTQLRGMNLGIRNANDGISMSQIAEGGLSQVSEMLQRMRELAVQSSNGAYSDADRENLNKEFESLNSEVSRIASTTTFNGESVLAMGSSATNIQVGANAAAEDTLTIAPVEVQAISGDINSIASSQASIDAIDALVADVSDSRSYFGAMQSRLESAIQNLEIGMENQAAAHGRIMDADYATESANLASAQVLQRAGTAMSVQANASASSVMSLLA